MVSSLSQKVSQINIGFSVFDQLSYSDNSLPFGDVLSADRVRDIFADSDALLGSGENDCWNTGLTLWSFIGHGSRRRMNLSDQNWGNTTLGKSPATPSAIAPAASNPASSNADPSLIL